MRCERPFYMGFDSQGEKTFSPKKYNKEFPVYQLGCGKCVHCMLDYSNSWAIRVMHEAQMHKNNIFATLTYSDDKLESPYLIYEHFQKFMKKLRHLSNDPIGFFVTGEYGDEKLRPHWHAIIFNWSPSDATYQYSNDLGDKLYTSRTLTDTWGYGHANYGSVTIQSARYVARYAAKALSSPEKQDLAYKPISKKSSKHAIGKKFLEQYYSDIFNYGKLSYRDGDRIVQQSSIPRYYEKWLEKNHGAAYDRYVNTIKFPRQEEAIRKTKIAEEQFLQIVQKRIRDKGYVTNPLTPQQIQSTITKKNLEERINRFLKF